MTVSITPEVKETSPTPYQQEGSLGVRKGGHHSMVNVILLCTGIHLGKKSQMKKAQGQGRYGERSKITGQRRTKGQKSCPIYMVSLPPHHRGPSLWLGVPLLFLSKHTVSACDLPHVVLCL